MSIEKIEIEFRALIGPDAETLADGVRLGALIRTGHALLDELSRLRTALKHIANHTSMLDELENCMEMRRIAARALSTQVEERE